MKFQKCAEYTAPISPRVQAQNCRMKRPIHLPQENENKCKSGALPPETGPWPVCCRCWRSSRQSSRRSIPRCQFLRNFAAEHTLLLPETSVHAPLGSLRLLQENGRTREAQPLLRSDIWSAFRSWQPWCRRRRSVLPGRQYSQNQWNISSRRH